MNQFPQHQGSGGALTHQQVRALHQITRLLAQLQLNFGPESPEESTNASSDPIKLYRNIFGCVLEARSTTGVYCAWNGAPTPENPLQLGFLSPETYEKYALTPESQDTAFDLLDTLADECLKKFIPNFDTLDTTELQEILFKDGLFADIFQWMKEGNPLQGQWGSIVHNFKIARRIERTKRGMGCHYGIRIMSDEGGNMIFTVPAAPSPDSSTVPLTSTIRPAAVDFIVRLVLSIPQLSLEEIARVLNLLRLVVKDLFAFASSTIISRLMDKIRIYPELEPLRRSLNSLDPTIVGDRRKIINSTNDILAQLIRFAMKQAANGDPNGHYFQEASMFIAQALIARRWNIRCVILRPFDPTLRAFTENCGVKAFLQDLRQQQNHRLDLFNAVITDDDNDVDLEYADDAPVDNNHPDAMQVQPTSNEGMGYGPPPPAQNHSFLAQSRHYHSQQLPSASAASNPSAFGSNTPFSVSHMTNASAAEPPTARTSTHFVATHRTIHQSAVATNTGTQFPTTIHQPTARPNTHFGTPHSMQQSTAGANPRFTTTHSMQHSSSTARGNTQFRASTVQPTQQATVPAASQFAAHPVQQATVPAASQFAAHPVQQATVSVASQFGAHPMQQAPAGANPQFATGQPVQPTQPFSQYQTGGFAPYSSNVYPGDQAQHHAGSGTQWLAYDPNDEEPGNLGLRPMGDGSLGGRVDVPRAGRS